MGELRQSSTKAARWFSLRLNRRNAPWVFLKGEPFRNIASLELTAVFVSVMLFGNNPAWRGGHRSVMFNAYTDNLGNSHVLKKFASSRYPLCIIVMELAKQLDDLELEMELQWVPRGQPVEADDLTNERFTDFSPDRRIEVDFEKLTFKVMGDLRKLVGELDEEMKLKKTSKEGKVRPREEQPPAKQAKPKKGQMRWEGPW